MSAPPSILSVDVNSNSHPLGAVEEKREKIYDNGVNITAVARSENRSAFLSFDSGPLKQA